MLSQEILKLEVELQHLKEENEELRRLLGVDPPKPMNCQACTFFIQHYMEAGSGYIKTNDGHCVHEKGKIRTRRQHMRKNLKEARQAAGMTQKEVADYLKITIRAYQQIEKGDYQGKIAHWDKLEDLFNTHQRKLRVNYSS